MRRVVALAVVVALVAVAVPASAAELPVDVSGPVDGSGPGLEVDPGDPVRGAEVELVGEHLPDATEAAAWDLADPTTLVGTYTGPVTVALCGNADASGAALDPLDFDAATDCDGGDARSSQLVEVADVTGGDLAVTLTPRDGTGTFTWDDDGDPATADVDAGAGIGSADRRCVPVDPADVLAGSVPACAFLVRDGATPGALGSTFVGRAPFVVRPVPELVVTAVVGRPAGSVAARAGDVVELGGTEWDPTATLTVAWCEPDAAVGCEPLLATYGITADGVLSAAVTIDEAVTPATREISVTQSTDGQLASAPFTVLGARTVTVDPPNGPTGTAVTIDGTGFDPFAAVTVTGWDGEAATTDVGAATVDAAGVLTGSIVVDDATTVAIVVREDDAPDTELASAAFTIDAQEQTPEVTISAGALTLSQAASTIQMTPIVLSGEPEASTGELNTLVVTDARGTLVGWTVTAVVTDFVDVNESEPGDAPSTHVIPAGNLSWTPACAPAPGTGGVPAEVAAGAPGPFDPTTPRTLCSAPPGGGGGTWHLDAELSLMVPASIAASQYRATLTLLVS